MVDVNLITAVKSDSRTFFRNGPSVVGDKKYGPDETVSKGWPSMRSIMFNPVHRKQ
jgi:hypothetical protein